MDKLNIVTVNVNGLGGKNKRLQTFTYLKSLKADVICIQETHGHNPVTVNQWTTEWGGAAFWSCGTSVSCGTAILLPPSSDLRISEVKTDNDGRLVSIVATSNNHQINIVSIYAPTDTVERRNFFEHLHLYTTPANNTVFAGDFNCISNIALDKTGGNPTRGSAGSDNLHTQTLALGITDIFRYHFPNKKEFTWHNADYSIGTRLDRIYAKPSTTLPNPKILYCPFSDHCAFSIHIKVPNSNSRGRGVWKMNVDTHRDPDCHDELAAFINYWPHEQPLFPDIASWLDEGKLRIKGIAIKHSVKRSRIRELHELQSSIVQLQQQPLPVINQINILKRELKDHLDRTFQGARIRSRAN